MDVIVFWVLAIVLFAVASVLFAPDSRDLRRPGDRVGSWVALGA